MTEEQKQRIRDSQERYRKNMTEEQKQRKSDYQEQYRKILQKNKSKNLEIIKKTDITT